MSGEDSRRGDSVPAALASVRARVSEAYRAYSDAHPTSPLCQEPRLVAISKTKDPEMVLAAYQSGQRHFGENYVQELVEKANHPLLCHLPDIHWHFVGHLQRNKTNTLTTGVAQLWAVETVDSQRLATALDTSWRRRESGGRLKVFVQVNTSGEVSKHGCSPAATPALVRHITDTCSCLEFIGLMTIGERGHDYSTGRPNPDFQQLLEVRSKVCECLGVSPKLVEMSMGMSADYEQAIAAGSTNVRLGSVIFGSRPPKRSQQS